MKEFFTIQGQKQIKYPNFAKVTDACRKLPTGKYIIERHQIDEVSFYVKNENKLKDISNFVDKFKAYLGKIKFKALPEKLYIAEELNRFILYYWEASKSEEEIERNKDDKDWFIWKILQNFVYQILNDYPLDKIVVRKIITDYKPCNGIQICFDDLPDVLNYGSVEEENLPYYFYITLRGDTDDKSIVFDIAEAAFGHHVNTSGYKHVDLSDTKMQQYINEVFAQVFKNIKI